VRRVVFFIDGSNIYSHLRDVFGNGRVHIPTLCGELTEQGERFLQWRYYVAALPQGEAPDERLSYSAQQRFLQYVRNHRKGELCLGRFQRDDRGCLREKGVDVRLSIDLVRMAIHDEYDAAVVLSGDGDIVPAIETVIQDYNKEVFVALPAAVGAYHIRQAVGPSHFREITASIYRRARVALRASGT